MKTFDKTFWISLISFIIVVGALCAAPYLMVKSEWVKSNLDLKNDVASNFGNILSPLVAIAAALLTFIAFWVQYKANQQQRYDIRVERLESRFYELLRLHRDNVSELTVDNELSGRNVFFFMLEELRFLYKAIEEKTTTWQDANHVQRDKRSNMNLAYKIFFYGSDNTERQLRNALSEEESAIYDRVKPLLRGPKEVFPNVLPHLRPYEHKWNNESDDRFLFMYVPFQGHSQRLGHYFRHLYQSVKYIAKQEDRIVDGLLKYGYLKMLRSQLSDYEQLLLYYNSLSDLGVKWLEKGYFKDYAFIKNIPIGLIDIPELDPRLIVGRINKEGQPLFEYDRIKPANNVN